MTLRSAQLDSVVDLRLLGGGDVLRTAHGQGSARERAAAGSGTGFTTQEAAFRKPSLRRNRFSKNLHFGGICGISPLFHHMFSRKGRRAHLIYQPFHATLHTTHSHKCTGYSSSTVKPETRFSTRYKCAHNMIEQN